MALTSRVWTAGKVLLLCGAWVATYLLFAGVAMRVALRMREVPVPDVRGRTVSDATGLLAGAGLALSVEKAQRVDQTVAAGSIVEQDPAPGVQTRRQRSVRVWLSVGSRPTRVPSLIGEQAGAAERRLARDSLRLVGVAEIRSRDYSGGSVVAQHPPGEAEGTEVSLLVNRGEPDASFVMPELIGIAGDRASEILRIRGFRVSVAGEHPYPGVPPGIVLRQHPAAGFQVSPGETISLEVSR